MTSNGDGSYFGGMQEAILQEEEDRNSWCSSSGENVGSMIEFPGSQSPVLTQANPSSSL